ncbi:MAG: FtsQ-type POTRA domain-containing protein, partial [Heliobacteriaceae bacterium]|nr:FtsQ-type POTRA domain-containing protein [Heliobacteriaceae bacterium]
MADENDIEILRHGEPQNDGGEDSGRLVKTKQRERHVRKSRKKRETIRTVSRFFITIALAAGLYFLAVCPQWYLNKNAFSYVNSNIIEVSNNKIVPSYKILAILKKNNVPDLPIYMMGVNELKTQIRQLGPVEKVYIRRYAFPARLQIIVKERMPVLTISPDLKSLPVAFFTDDGKLIGREYLPLSRDFSTILVLSYGNKGDDYTKWDKAKIR